MPRYLPNGIGSVIGANLATKRPLHTTGRVWYVHHELGEDDAETHGLERNAPMASIGSVFDEAEGGDIIVAMRGHVEEPTTTLAMPAGVTIVGEAESAGVPGAWVVPETNDEPWLSMGGNTQIIGLGVRSPSTWLAGGILMQDAFGVRLQGMVFECGGGPQDAVYPVLEIEAGGLISVVNSRFTSHASSVATRPEPAVVLTVDPTMIEFSGVVFDDGEYGFITKDGRPLALDASAAEGNQPFFTIRGTDISLLRGADVDLGKYAGYWHVGTSTGDARVEWEGPEET